MSIGAQSALASFVQRLRAAFPAREPRNRLELTELQATMTRTLAYLVGLGLVFFLFWSVYNSGMIWLAPFTALVNLLGILFSSWLRRLAQAGGVSLGTVLLAFGCLLSHMLMGLLFCALFKGVQSDMHDPLLPLTPAEYRADFWVNLFPSGLLTCLYFVAILVSVFTLSSEIRTLRRSFGIKKSRG